MSDLEIKAQQASAVIAPSELHGMVCGFAAGCPEDFSLSDFVQLAGADALSDETAVTDFIATSLDEFYAEDMGFAPLLADDNEMLTTRLAGLAEWCAGFLSGFGASVATYRTRQSLHLDIQEILGDFASISGLDEDVQDDEQDENAFMELHEYVRVAAVLVATLMTQDESSAEGDVVR